MKPKKIALIIGSIVFAILGFMLIVPVLIMDKSVLYFIIPLGFFILVGIVILIVYLINKAKKKEAKEEITMDQAKKIVKDTILNDEDNPDNFVIYEQQPVNVGDRKSTPTPIGVFVGKGTETNQNITAIINLANPRKAPAILRDRTKKEIDEQIRLTAEYPPERDVVEETITKLDAFGRPMTTTRVNRPTPLLTPVEKEKKEASENEGI